MENKYRTILAAGVLFVAVGLWGCAKTAENSSDPAKLTMYVGLGNTNNSGEYYKQLHELILKDTGIDVHYVYSNTLDTSSAMLECLSHGDLPADIVVTAAQSPAEIQEKVFLDLASYTNIPDRFNASRLQQLSVNGAVYQLPFTSRLIGLEYNKTLLEEMGWELPANFEEMKALKEKAAEAGIPFALSAAVATGHGFNYLCHIMGTQYLSSAAGTEWLEDFQAGTAVVDEFAEQAEYFREYTDAGMFGQVHDEDWRAGETFAKTRALFYYNNTNDIYSYEGETEDGKTVSDVYASMPWISRNGNSNCFTVYDSMFLALDKKLGEDTQKEKLEKACTVLEYMTTEPVVRLFCEMYPDGYISTNSFTVEDTRFYSDSAEAVEKGYLQPWYYNYFDLESIVNVGQLVNDYMREAEEHGQEPDWNGQDNMRKIVEELSARNEENLNGTAEILAEFETDLSYEESAKLQASANAMAAQQALEEAGIPEEVTVSLMPYVKSLAELPLYQAAAVEQARFYQGQLTAAQSKYPIPSKASKCVVVRMNGEELKRIVNSGLTVETEEENGKTVATAGRHFPYACVQKGKKGAEPKLKGSETYLVAVPQAALDASVYETLEAAGAVLMNGEKPLQADAETGLKLYFKKNPAVKADGIGF